MSHSPPDDSRARSSRRDALRASSGVDLGHEPPLNPEGGAAPEIDPREISLRWLGASVLTGVTGAALIGASIYIALEGASPSALPPERASLDMTQRAGPGRERPSRQVRKGDRLNLTEPANLARHSFRAPMTIRSGDREAIKVRQFVRVATNLSLTAGTYATDIPRFNPMRLFAEDSQERVEPVPEISDADVSVVRRELASLPVDAGAPSLADSD